MSAEDLDHLDRALVHALQVDGRAPFRRIGEVLGVSDQTVARRYARLRERRALRVVALTDPGVVDDHQWIFRVRSSPDVRPTAASAPGSTPTTCWC